VDIYKRIADFYDGVNAEKRIIGNSLFGRKLFAVKVGDGAPVGIAQYAIHGREFITARLAIEQYKKALAIKKDLNSRGINYLLNVGPDPLGRIPAPSIDILKSLTE